MSEREITDLVGVAELLEYGIFGHRGDIDREGSSLAARELRQEIAALFRGLDERMSHRTLGGLQVEIRNLIAAANEVAGEEE